MEKMKNEGNKQRELASQLAASEKKNEGLVKSTEKLQSQLFLVEKQLHTTEQILSEVGLMGAVNLAFTLTMLV